MLDIGGMIDAGMLNSSNASVQQLCAAVEKYNGLCSRAPNPTSNVTERANALHEVMRRLALYITSKPPSSGKRRMLQRWEALIALAEDAGREAAAMGVKLVRGDFVKISPNNTDELEQSARKLGCLYPHERSEVPMAGSYSTDLRERVLAAVEAGATPEAAGRRFAVGRSTAYRWATAARVEGRRAAKRVGGGPKPRITGEVEAALLGLLKEANHLTLADGRDRLAERTGVRVHPWTVGRALRRCGWT